MSRAVNKVATQCGGDHVEKGAFFRLFSLESRNAGMKGLVELMNGWAGGKRNIENIEKYKVISYEKALRLALNSSLHGHVTSFESASEYHQRYQGATLVGAEVPGLGKTTLVISLSGLPSAGDERAGLLTVDKMNWGAGHDIHTALVTTGNQEAYLALRQ